MEEILIELQKNGIEYDDYQFVQSDEKSYVNGKVIYYQKKYDALLLLLNKEITSVDTPIKKRGIMVDCSRGKAYTIESLKKYIFKAACLGITYVTLYLEDMIELENYPTFGYLRGKYKKEELRELVRYAQKFDIEVYPCIQTLGHMENFLKWNNNSGYRDTNNVLLVNDDKVKALIKELIFTCKDIFENEVINVGLDEAFELGLGNSYRRDGFIAPKTLFMEHVKYVEQVCIEAGYQKIQMWSDMLFSVYANTAGEGLYSSNFDFQTISTLSEKFQLVYWNYWTKNKQEYLNVIDQHRCFAQNVSLALGIHSWGVPFYVESELEATMAGLSAAKEKEIDDVLFTIWHDDNGLCQLDSILYGMYITMMSVYNSERNSEDYQNIFQANLADMQQISSHANNGLNLNSMLWDDPILNIYKKNISSEKLSIILKRLEVSKYNEDNDSQLYENYRCLNEYLIAELHLYLEGPNEKLVLKALSKFEIYVETFTQLWNKEAKHIGFEEVQKRFNNKMMRYKFLLTNLDNEEVIKIINETTSVGLTSSYDYVAKTRA